MPFVGTDAFAPFDESQYWAVRDYLSPVSRRMDLVNGRKRGINACIVCYVLERPLIVSCFVYQVLKESKFKEHGRITPGELEYRRPLSRD